MTRLLPDDVAAHLKDYYLARKDQSTFGARKPIILDALGVTVGRGTAIVSWSASCGTFWFQWEDGLVTEHSEKNWWLCKHSTCCAERCTHGR